MLERIKPLPSLVNEMLDQLPKSVWTSETTTFLDPAIGGGQFVREVEARLRAAGHSDENIRSRVFGFEYTLALVDIAINMVPSRKLVGQYVKLPYDQFFNLDINVKKFDVVLGNPPYQSGNSSKGNKLWPKFILKTTELTAPGGFNCLVTPTGWSSGGTNIPGGKGVIKDVFSKNQVLAINCNEISKTYFPKVGIEIGYFILHKVAPTIPTTLILTDGESTVDFTKVEFISPRLNKIDISIVNKVFFSKHELFNVESFDRSITRGSITEHQTGSKKYKFKHWILGGSTANNAGFTWLNFENSPKLKYPKVVFNIGNRYWQPYYDFESVNVAAQGFAIKLTGKEKIEALKSVFESELYTYISWWYQLQMKGFMKTNIVKSYPKLDLNRIWTNDEIFKEFKISKVEQKHIKNALASTKHS